MNIKKTMKIKKTTIRNIALVLLIVVVSALLYMFSSSAKVISDGGYVTADAVNLDDTQDTSLNLAQCLTQKGVKMYGTSWCGHCNNQKAAFGESFKYIDFVDCDQRGDECSSAGVRGYPTWIINGASYPGEQSLERLASLAGCDA